MFYRSKTCPSNKLQAIFPSNCKTKRLQYYDWWKHFFWSAKKNDRATYVNIRKTATGHRDDYVTDCLISYVYFQSHYKMIAIDLSKQQALDAGRKAVQKINFTGNLDQAGRNNNVFHYWRSKRNHSRFFARNCESIIKLFWFNIILI